MGYKIEQCVNAVKYELSFWLALEDAIAKILSDLGATFFPLMRLFCFCGLWCHLLYFVCNFDPLCICNLCHEFTPIPEV